MSVLSSYRRLFALTGPLYVVVAFVARLPMAMSQMGILLLVAEVSGSYGGGGAAAGAFAVVNALASPLAGALTDRIGQRPVLLVQSVGGALALLALVVLSGQDVPWQLLAVVSGVAGVFVPQVGTLARVRWRELTRAKGGQGFKLLSTAFSYEGAADEASFVLGPAIVGTTAAVVSPAGALLLAAGGLAVFATWFALHPTVALVRGHRGVRDGAGGRVGPLLLGLAAGQLLVGAIFGSVQAGTTALATVAGEPGLAGLLHAVLGIGSVVAGLAIVVLPERFRLADRLPVFAGGLAVLTVPLLAVHSLGTLAAVLLVLGLAVAPYMITIFSACERVVDPSRLGAAMMVLAAATSLGYALGSSTAGRLADVGSYPFAYRVTIAAGTAALLLSLVLRTALHRRRRRMGEKS
ncbi:MFS transporter [uncultured Georgenia sp.]|uniref:MFS transporter n=1 Tax=uncultured Georgenia sp. TaxID=378209 RepID=UPI0026191766|nr:MFS transporter [uncultured Georgenia sp.]